MQNKIFIPIMNQLLERKEMFSWTKRYSAKDPWAVEGEPAFIPKPKKNIEDIPASNKKLPVFKFNDHLRGHAFFDDFTEQVKNRRSLNGSEGYEELTPEAFAQSTRDFQKSLGLYGNRDGKTQSHWWRKTGEQNWEHQHSSELAMGEIHPDRMYKTPCKPNCMSKACRVSNGTYDDSIPDIAMDKANEILKRSPAGEQKRPGRTSIDDLRREMGLDD